MKNHFEAKLTSNSVINKVITLLKSYGVNDHYLVDPCDKTALSIGFSTEMCKEQLDLSFFTEIKQISNEVNWEEQWKSYHPNMENGIVSLPLKGISTPIQLKAGPGFGDLSHPTTQLMVENSKEFVKDALVIDIGCGSGILSLVASAYGAREVIGIDIDPEAVAHANKNLELNAFKKISFLQTLPKLSPGPLVVLINMVLSEQQNVFAAYPELLTRANTLFLVSGILASMREHFFNHPLYKNHAVIKEKTNDEWLFIALKSK